MSENLKINFDEIQTPEGKFDNKKRTEELWGQANSILSAFSKRFGENSEQYKKVLKEYGDLYDSIQKAKNNITDKTNLETKELKDYIDSQEQLNISKEANEVIDIFESSDLNISTNNINIASISKLSIEEKNALFIYYSEDYTKLNSITNKEFIEEFFSFIKSQKDFKNYNLLYSNLNYKIQNDITIALLFIENSKDFSYISKVLLNEKNNLENILKDSRLLKKLGYINKVSNLENLNTKIENNSEVINDNFYKQLFSKIDNDETIKFLIDFCVKNEGIKIFDYFPVEKYIKEKNIQDKDYKGFIDNTIKVNNTNIPQGFKPKQYEVYDLGNESIKIFISAIYDKTTLSNYYGNAILGLNDIINSYITPAKINTKEEIINFLNNEKNKTTIINIINDYISASKVNGKIDNNIKKEVFKLLQNGNYSDLYSIQNNKDLLKEYLKTENSGLGIIFEFSYEQFDTEMYNIIIDHKDFNLNYILFFKINEFGELNNIYTKLKEKNYSKEDILLNPKFSEYIEHFKKNGKSLEIINDYEKLKEDLGKGLAGLNRMTLEYNKEEIIEIIKTIGFNSIQPEEIYNYFLIGSKGLTESKYIYLKLLNRVGKENEGKLRELYKKIINLQSSYIEDTTIMGKFTQDINDKLKLINLDEIFLKKPDIKRLFKGKAIDINIVISEFEKFSQSYKKNENDSIEFYQWKVRNEFINNLGLDKDLSPDEIMLKEILLNITKIDFLKKDLKQKINIQDSYFKYLSGEITQKDYFAKVDEYKKNEEQFEVRKNNKSNENLQENTEYSPIPELTKTSSGYNFTTTTTNGSKVELPITTYEAALINGSEKTKENFKKFTEVLSDLNLLNLWKFRESIFKAISEKNGIAFNANDDFLKQEEVKLFLVSIVSSISNKLSLEQQNGLGTHSQFESELIDPNYIQNKSLNEIVTSIKKINVVGKGKDSITGYSPIEDAFLKTFTDENDRGKFLQDKFKQYI